MILKREKINPEDLVPDDVLDIIFRDRIRYASLHSSALNHEIYMPLLIIRGLAESLLRKPAQDPQAHLHEISNESARVLKLLDSMNFLAPVEPVKKQKISLRTMVEQVVLLHEQQCLDKSISIHIDVSETAVVDSEPYRLQSIIGALLQNSIESFANKPAKDVKSITIHLKENANEIHLTIADTGMGISSSIQTKITEEIFSSRKSYGIKSGLGLIMAKKLADDLDISLEFISEIRRGSSFTLTFKK